MKRFFALCLVVASLPTSAATPLEQALELCRAEQNALRRLSCYDAINANTAASLATATPQTAHTDAVAPATENNNFGLEHKAKEQDMAEKLNVIVSSVNYSPRKELIVGFDNGQSWRQIGSDHYSISVGEQHYIKRGVLNSFFLGNDNNNRTVRIKRDK